MIGIYSEQQRQLIERLRANGSGYRAAVNIYTQEGGAEVSVTEINETGKSRFKDAVVVGPVLNWVRAQ